MILSDFHGWRNSVRWRVDIDGVQIEGQDGPERTAGKPVTLRRIWTDFQQPVQYHGLAYGVPAAIILANIATESGGHVDAIRLEPGYVSDETTPGKVSPGLMQTLLSTAREAIGEPDLHREFLLRPEGSIQAGTAYIARQARMTGLDPPLVAAAYNSGGLYHEDVTENRWRLRCYPLRTGHHIDRWVRFYGDACAVLRETDLTSG